MVLVNKQVMHKDFGKGTVIKYNDSYVEIDFLTDSSGNKTFIFPDAFGKHLILIDQKAADLADKMVQERKQERKALQNERWQRLIGQKRLVKERKTRKIHPRSQSVFWCKAQEQDDIFTQWAVFTGLIKSGQKKGQPKRLAQMNYNSACLLTARDSDMPEKNRRILGAFLVKENFSPEQCKDGYIHAHPDYRFRLSEQESEKMLFWNYYVNKKYPHKMTWNAGQHRYFDNIWMAEILQDIISLKDKTPEQEGVQRFFDYFCQINLIEKEEIPKPDGALKRI